MLAVMKVHRINVWQVAGFRLSDLLLQNVKAQITRSQPRKVA